MGIVILVAGLVLFIGMHSNNSFAPQWRQARIGQLGELSWKGVFSAVSLAGLVLIVWGFSLTRLDPVFVWTPPGWTRHVAGLFSVLGLLLIVAAYVPRNHFKVKLGHPMYAGIKLWAFAHLLANGRLGDILLFGTFLVWAIIGFTRSRKRDKAAGISYGEASGVATAVTVVIALVLAVIIIQYLHLRLIGVPVH